MIGNNGNIRFGLVISAAILVGVGAAAALSRGIEFVVASDIHPTITEPLDDYYKPRRAPSAARSAASPYPPAGADLGPPAPEAPYAAESSPYPPATVIGEYSTKFSSGQKSRNENIRRAAGAISGIVIEPGEVFSYNAAVGPTTEQTGYKRARVFIRGKKAFGYGGGVCQVSSTLYNAAAAADMEIIERHGHSLPVEYVPKRRDAATSYGGIDFKFKNTRGYPVKIETMVTENALTVQLVYFRGPAAPES